MPVGPVVTYANFLSRTRIRRNVLIATYDEQEVNLQTLRAVSKLGDRHEKYEQQTVTR
jgi:hypothetical protein